MSAISDLALWRRLRTPSFALLALAIAFALIRARDQPDISLSLGGTTASIVPGDVLLAALFVLSVAAILRRRATVCWWIVAPGALFCLLVVTTAAANGTDAFVSGVKLVELAALGLGILVLVRTVDDLDAVVDVLLLFTIAADAIGIAKFVSGGGGRQASFLGEHDFAALATLPLLYGLVLVFRREHAARAAIGIVAGGVGCILGAALASLLGFYLGTAILLLVERRRLTLRPLLVTAATIAIVTVGTLTLRAGALGFLQSWFGKPPSRPGQYASSWSQRLIYTYVGFRVFLDHPVLGTGWYPLVPPSEFDRYLPAARRRYSDQPARYFPPADRPLIPQQTFDEVAAELGVVGSLALLATFAGAIRGASRHTLPAAWLAAAAGAAGGEALYGGTPLTAIVWIVVGVCGASVFQTLRK